jgi:signal transduction histidine kinase
MSAKTIMQGELGTRLPVQGIGDELDAAGVGVHGNRQLLAQALANLLDNAIKYTPDGRRIGIRVRATDGLTQLEVWDDGPGIPEADRARVLERFVRLGSSHTTPGNGLGLSLVAAVAKLHGARLILGDNAPGLSVVMAFQQAEDDRPA